MRGIIASLPFALLTVLCWGSYGPALHSGKEGMNGNAWMQLLCVGISYFVVAVLVPWYVLKTKGEQGEWKVGGVKWGLAAGALGAFGALGIITALTNGGSPSYVMPIVFGCAPVVNTIVSMYMTKLFKEITPGFYLGIILVALGACGVFAFKPKAEAKSHAQVQAELTTVSFNEAEATPKKTTSAVVETAPKKEINLLLIVGGISLTVISWGAYGSVLHKSQHLMKGSRLRPLLCVGFSYFALAVIIPLLIMSNSGFPKDPTAAGWGFSLLAGICGSVGALGIILSFTFGGKPVFVMPLVFGGAPIINTIISVLEMQQVGDISPFFFASLTIVIVGAIVTLVTAPKPGKKPKAIEEDEKPLWDQSREGSAANLKVVRDDNDSDAEEVKEVETSEAEEAESTAEPTEDNDSEDTPAEESSETASEADADEDTPADADDDTE